VVALSSFTYPDGAPADGEVAQVEVDASSCHMTAKDARTLVQAILEALEVAQSTS
jgi:hypothetical protein